MTCMRNVSADELLAGSSAAGKRFYYFLPPANEVWGKVMFLQLCVILFMGGVASQHASQVT